MANIKSPFLYLINSPFWLRWYYPGSTWHMNRQENSVYLTFDDGPIPIVTPFVLNTLQKFDAKATFFCIGDNVIKSPDIYSDILAYGHAVGNHTFNHLKGWDSTDTEYLADVRKCADLVQSSLFRPPYGKIKKTQAALIRDQFPEMRIVMWDVLSGDFDTGISGERCLKNVLKATRNGSIIVFHDSIKAFPRLEYALPRVLESLSAKGYTFKTL